MGTSLNPQSLEICMAVRVTGGAGRLARSPSAVARWRAPVGPRPRASALSRASRATIKIKVTRMDSARTNLGVCYYTVVPPTVKLKLLDLQSQLCIFSHLYAHEPTATRRRRGHVHAHVARQGDERTSPQATRTCTKHRLVRHRACPRPGSICGSKRPMLRRCCASRGRRRRSLASRRLYSRP